MILVKENLVKHKQKKSIKPLAKLILMILLTFSLLVLCVSEKCKGFNINVRIIDSHPDVCKLL